MLHQEMLAGAPWGNTPSAQNATPLLPHQLKPISISSSPSHPITHPPLTMRSPNAPPICDDGGESSPSSAEAEPCAPTYVDSNGVWCCLWCGRAYAC